MAAVVVGRIGSMEAEGLEARAFPEGSTVVRRDVLGGKVWTAAPYRVIGDTGTELTLACWPGVEMLAPTTWIEWLRTGDDAVRSQGISNLAAGRWKLDRWTWRDTTVLARLGAGQYFSVSQLFDPGGRCGGWYVDFVRPASALESASTLSTCWWTSSWRLTCRGTGGRTRMSTPTAAASG